MLWFYARPSAIVGLFWIAAVFLLVLFLIVKTAALLERLSDSAPVRLAMLARVVYEASQHPQILPQLLCSRQCKSLQCPHEITKCMMVLVLQCRTPELFLVYISKSSSSRVKSAPLG
jgi:hypothetical protein